MLEIQIITCEYAPNVGGVADYTKIVASELVLRGWIVNVWGPKQDKEDTNDNKIQYHDNLGTFRYSDLRKADKELSKQVEPRCLFVQWVPHGYGYKSLNILFCFWILKRAKINHDHIILMIHEPFLPFSKSSIRQNVAAVIHRLMITILLLAPRHIFISIPGWKSRIKPYLLNKKIPIEWLPIPSTVSEYQDKDRVRQIRNKYIKEGTAIIGHFGTYGSLITPMLEKIISGLLASGMNNWQMVLVGKRSHEFREKLEKRLPQLKNMVHSTGVLNEKELSFYIQACDFFVQPYPDGVSSRRTSAMAILAHGCPIVTTKGVLTEPLWQTSNVVYLANAEDCFGMIELCNKLLSDENEKKRLVPEVKMFYENHFSIDRIIHALTEASLAAC